METGSVAARWAGRVQTIAYDEGQRVPAGAVWARRQPTPLAQVAAAIRDSARTDLADTRLLAPNGRVVFTRAVEPGAIAAIAPTAQFTPKIAQADDLRADLVYRLRIIVNDPDDTLRQGATVTVLVSEARAGQ